MSAVPMTCTCRKCGQEVAPGPRCPVCGAKLVPSRAHLTWECGAVPVRSWVAWNAAARVVAPVLLLTAAMLFAAEAVSGGFEAAVSLFSGPLGIALAAAVPASLALTALVLWLRGRELMVVTADKSGVRLRVSLVDPSPVKLLLRGRSPAMARTEEARAAGLAPLGERGIAWKDVRRVQLWPEQGLVLFYAPFWWQRLAVPCTADGWEELLDLVTEKLGRRRDVRLPACLKAPPKAKTAPRSKPKERQMTVEDILPEEPFAGESFPEDPFAEETPEVLPPETGPDSPA